MSTNEPKLTTEPTPARVETKAEPSVAKVVKGEVKYIGRATRRVISKEEWEGVGAPNQPSTEWNFQNGFSLPLSDFSEEALDYIRKDDGLEIKS